jgi:hypothetical protein
MGVRLICEYTNPCSLITPLPPLTVNVADSLAEFGVTLRASWRTNLVTAEAVTAEVLKLCTVSLYMTSPDRSMAYARKKYNASGVRDCISHVKLPDAVFMCLTLSSLVVGN